MSDMGSTFRGEEMWKTGNEIIGLESMIGDGLKDKFLNKEAF